MLSVVLRVNSVRTCPGLCTRWSAGWWRPWLTARSLYPETFRGTHLMRTHNTLSYIIFIYIYIQLSILRSSTVILGLSASLAPIKRPQASSTLWREASSMSTSRLCTCVLRRSPASTLPEAPPQHGPLTLRLRPSREISTPSAALRGEDRH